MKFILHVNNDTHPYVIVMATTVVPLEEELKCTLFNGNEHLCVSSYM